MSRLLWCSIVSYLVSCIQGFSCLNVVSSVSLLSSFAPAPPGVDHVVDVVNLVGDPGVFAPLQVLRYGVVVQKD